MLSFFNKFNRTSTKSKKAKKSQSTFMYIVCAILSKDDSPKVSLNLFKWLREFWELVLIHFFFLLFLVLFIA